MRGAPVGDAAANPVGGRRLLPARVLVSARKLVAVVAGVVVAFTSATACTGSGATDEPKRLRVLMTDDWATTAPVLAAVREFEARHEDVRVEIEKANISDMGDTVGAGMRAGNPPDVVQWHAYAAGARGLGQPLDDLWRKHLRESDYLGGAIEDVTWAGQKYGVPLDVNAMVLVFNANHFAQAGLTVPTDSMTFQDLERAAQGLTTPDGTRRATAYPSSTWWAYGWIRANGGELVEVGRDGKVTLTLDAPRVVEAVRFLGGLVQKGLAFPPRGGTTGEDVMALFRSGSTSLHATGSWDVATLEKEESTADYGTAMMPRGLKGDTEGSALGGSSLFVPKGSRHRLLAFEFMLLLTSDRYALPLAREEGRLPARLGLYEDRYFQAPHLQTFLRQLRSAHPVKLDAFPQAHAAFAQALDQVLNGRNDADAALREAQLQAVAALGLK